MDIRLQDYRSMTGQFDRIYSAPWKSWIGAMNGCRTMDGTIQRRLDFFGTEVGIFEHIGRNCYESLI